MYSRSVRNSLRSFAAAGSKCARIFLANKINRFARVLRLQCVKVLSEANTNDHLHELTAHKRAVCIKAIFDSRYIGRVFNIDNSEYLVQNTGITPFVFFRYEAVVQKIGVAAVPHSAGKWEGGRGMGRTPRVLDKIRYRITAQAAAERETRSESTYEFSFIAKPSPVEHAA